jgi:tetratricopeptide (TPR) repeat protein
MSTIQWLLLLIVLFTTPPFVHAQEAEYFINFMREGDAAYAKFDNEEASGFYQKAITSNPKDYEATWKLARAHIDLGKKLSAHQKRTSYFERARDYARKAIGLDPNGEKGHLYLSIALGRIALDTNAKQRVRLSKKIRSEVGIALNIDPQDDIAWHVLGRWHRRVSSLSWIEKKFAKIFFGGVPGEASMEKAIECFKKAIQLNNAHINHHLELAMTYDHLRQKDLASAEYSKVIELPVKKWDDHDHKAEAEERLRRLSDF